MKRLTPALRDELVPVPSGPNTSARGARLPVKGHPSAHLSRSTDLVTTEASLPQLQFLSQAAASLPEGQGSAEKSAEGPKCATAQPALVIKPATNLELQPGNPVGGGPVSLPNRSVTVAGYRAAAALLDVNTNAAHQQSSSTTMEGVADILHKAASQLENGYVPSGRPDGLAAAVRRSFGTVTQADAEPTTLGTRLSANTARASLPGPVEPLQDKPPQSAGAQGAARMQAARPGHHQAAAGLARGDDNVGVATTAARPLGPTTGADVTGNPTNAISASTSVVANTSASISISNCTSASSSSLCGTSASTCTALPHQPVILRIKRVQTAVPQAESGAEQSDGQA